NAGAVLIRFDLAPALRPLDRAPRHLVFVSDEARRILFHPDPARRPTPGRFYTLAEDPILGRSAAALTDPERGPEAAGRAQELALARHDAAADLPVQTEPQWFLAFDNLAGDDLRRLRDDDFYEKLAERHRDVIFDPLDQTARQLHLRSRGPDRAGLDD